MRCYSLVKLINKSNCCVFASWSRYFKEASSRKKPSSTVEIRSYEKQCWNFFYIHYRLIGNGIVLPSPNLTSGQPQVGIGTITTGYSKKLEPHNGRKLVKSWLGVSSTDRTLNMGLRCKFEAREKDCQPTET
jgi:hypothetical protein